MFYGNERKLFLFHFVSCPAERGEGAAFQLALFDDWFTEHGLGLFHTPRSCVHGGVGNAPIQRQQGMMGRGQIMRCQACEHGPISSWGDLTRLANCFWLIIRDVDGNQEHKDIDSLFLVK